jgi:hypothetical protein
MSIPTLLQLHQLADALSIASRPVRSGVIRSTIVACRHRGGVPRQILDILVNYFVKFRVDWCMELDDEAADHPDYEHVMTCEVKKALERHITSSGCSFGPTSSWHRHPLIQETLLHQLDEVRR